MPTGDFNVGTPIIGIYTLFSILSTFSGLLFYVLSSIGLMGMLKSCGYSKPYLAWIPIANIYATGKLAEYYDDKKPSKNHGKRLLIITIVKAALAIILVLVLAFAFVSMIVEIITAVAGSLQNVGQLESTEFPEIPEENISAFLVSLIIIVPFSLAAGVLSVIYLVFYYIALWRVYMLFSPSNTVAFLVLSIIFSDIAKPIIFFCLRNSKPVNLRIDYTAQVGGQPDYANNEQPL